MDAQLMLRETQVLMDANGNIALAAEALGTDGHALLRRVASEDADSIKQLLKVANAVHTLDTMVEVKSALLSRLDELSPSTLAKLYVELVEKTQEISLEQLQQNVWNDNRTLSFGNDARETIAAKITGLMQGGHEPHIVDVEQ